MVRLAYHELPSNRQREVRTGPHSEEFEAVDLKEVASKSHRLPRFALLLAGYLSGRDTAY
jgi:hypothetical protein